MTRKNRCITTLVAASLTWASMAHAAPLALIGAAEVAQTQGVVAADDEAAAQRAHVLSFLDRPEVVAGLTEQGVSAEQARERVAALTDAEVAQLAHTLDTAPAGAGAGGIVGAVVFIFVLLLVTDILGLTKVYPFTRSIR